MQVKLVTLDGPARLVNDGKHERVPTAVFNDAEKFAKVIATIHAHVHARDLSFHCLFRPHWKKQMTTTMKCRRIFPIQFLVFCVPSNVSLIFRFLFILLHLVLFLLLLLFWMTKYDHR